MTMFGKPFKADVKALIRLKNVGHFTFMIANTGPGTGISQFTLHRPLP
ncbi:hypothetical protein [Thermomonospora umbrina]|uniref:Uncharacterized protein n=1 Tax=Thermomonospora umbrina TaxID=111806 RepID=A0A3D9SNX5_9ACTN|nr:hypothetical protein [Thermomonospora umbrina]REE97676.1 hypothetical protein DFJ69_3150 [Thermomonospora umbrina]